MEKGPKSSQGPGWKECPLGGDAKSLLVFSEILAFQALVSNGGPTAPSCCPLEGSARKCRVPAPREPLTSLEQTLGDGR